MSSESIMSFDAEFQDSSANNHKFDGIKGPEVDIVIGTSAKGFNNYSINVKTHNLDDQLVSKIVGLSSKLNAHCNELNNSGVVSF